MGQSLSRRPSSVSVQEHESNPQPTRRSLPRRILSSIPKPSIRSRPASLATSNTPPASSEQTRRGRKRLWRLSHRHDVPSNTVGDVPQHMGPLAEHDEHQDDRDVDEFGVITNRVSDSKRDSSTSSPKGKEKAREIFNDDEANADRSATIPSSSTTRPITPPSQVDDQDEVVIAPTDPPSLSRQPSPLPRIQESEASFVPPAPTPAPQPQLPQTNTNPRPFPPPGTLVVVQGVVHTTDVPRPPERSAPGVNPSLSTPTHDDPSQNTSRVPGLDASSARPSSAPPSSRSRNSLSGIPPRPFSMVPAVPSSPPSDSSPEASTSSSQGRQNTSNADSAVRENESEDRAQPHGISMAQGPAGASGLSASSIDVLGTLLSVAAAATAASLLTGSSEPIFSSGLTSSQPQPPSNPIPPPSSFNSGPPSERPLSPTPTSDAGRMRHVWSSLRDRLGLGSGANSSNASNDITSTPGLGTSPQASDVVRPRDPREIMLAEMARAFNLGLGLGGPTGNTSSVPSPNSNNPEVSSPNNGNVPAGDRDMDQPSLPPPDSFERFLMDLQNDLRVTLMQSHEPAIFEGGRAPQDSDAIGDDIMEDDDEPLPELRSISDSDSEEYEPRLYDSDHDEGLDPEDDEDDEDEDVHTAHEELSGRASPAVSALGTGIHSPFGVRRIPEFPTPIAPTAPAQSIALSSVSDAEAEANTSAANNNKTRDGDASHATCSVSSGIGSSLPSETRPQEGQEGHSEGVVLGMGYSPEASNAAQATEVEGGRAVSGNFAVPPHGAQSPSNVPGTEPARNSFLLETSSSGASTSNVPTVSTGASASTVETSALPSTSTSAPSSAPRNSSPAGATLGDSSMPFRLPFTASSASRTEHTPGGGINWWRMYRFPAIASPMTAQQGQGSQPPSQSPSPLRNLPQGPSLSSPSPWIRTPDQTQQNEVMVPREEPQLPGPLNGLSAPLLGPPAPPTNMPGLVPVANQSTGTNTSENFSPPTNPNANGPEHRGVVVPVIVVGLQSVNMDRQRPHTPHPQPHDHQHIPPMDSDDGEDVDFDSFDQPMSMPMHVPEPSGFPPSSSPSHTSQQEHQGSQQPSRGRTWQNRAANAFRNFRPSRRNADAVSPQPQETPGSRTFLIYVIGGYYPPDHQIITGGNLDSFEALWELAELLGQVKPPTVSKEEIDKSGLEVIRSSMLEEYERSGLVASNCVDRCLICLDDYSPDDDLRILTCKHTFHQGCVDRWLETGRNNCPACRSKGVGTDNAASTSATPSEPPVPI